jgi:hypothetical protein
MYKEFIPYELADELKELGFTGGEGRYYIEDLGMCERILWQQAFRWFREKHGLHHVVEYDPIDKVYSSLVRYDYLEDLPTYEEAELACLNKLIEIVKTNNHE